MSFWCLTTLFNPANYKSLVNNHSVFSNAITKQGCNLLTLELAFGEDKHHLEGKNIVHMRGKDVMWQKERLINHGTTLLPNDCTAYAWIDADVLFADDNWIEKAEALLKKHEIIQLFQRVFYLPQGHKCYNGEQCCEFYSITWQANKYRNWLERRSEKDIPFGAPGFAWAAKRGIIEDCGIYDKDIIGSGDCLLVDCLLGSWKLHGFNRKFNERTKESIGKWCESINKKKISVGYLPVDVFHLWHGDLRNRLYMRRHQTLLTHDFDPEKDIVLNNGVWEWATDKKEMHEEVKNYFYQRKEDEGG